MTQSEWKKLSYAEKNRQLYFRQKQLLDTFLEHHAISNGFDLQNNLYRFIPSAYHKDIDGLFEMARRFVEMETDVPQIFYIWGHSYEFDA